MPKKEEANDIIQYLLPKLSEVNIGREYCKIDVTTEKTGNKRGDIWISESKQSSLKFESKIVALIEAKHKKCNIGDINWRNAMKQGKEKAATQNLSYYIVTNCVNDTRFYNAVNDEEISLDGKAITAFLSVDILVKIQTQVNEGNSVVHHIVKKNAEEFTEAEFRKSLRTLEQIYRSVGLKKGDERIDPTVSFVVLKYISEKESEVRTLPNVIQLWDDFRDIANDKETRDLSSEFKATIGLIWGDGSQHKDNQYADFKDLVKFSSKLKHEHFKKIYLELDFYHFHGGAKFDLFGTIYEKFATQSKKKEFGEFYTRRHITNLIAKLLLRDEKNFRNMLICDPACGTGGFLTEAFKVLMNNYVSNNQLADDNLKILRKETFWGYDNEPRSVARTKLNMFLVGDGHTHIHENDSLVDWNSERGWKENYFDYILANPPMGAYKGDANVDNYDFTNEKRYELLFLEKIVKAVKYGGHMAIVINDGALETPSRMIFRKKLLNYCNINAVVGLPKYAFAPYTKEKTYILFMQKKQKTSIRIIQEEPIWHFIIDYDGYANSDKRYKTKYHDDLPELESIFDGAMKVQKLFDVDKELFEDLKVKYLRRVNAREENEKLSGYKYKYVDMSEVNESNFYNLLSEKHLRPHEILQITNVEFNNRVENISLKLKSINIS